MGRISRFFLLILFGLLTAAILAILLFHETERSIGGTAPIGVVIRPGQSERDIGKLLSEAGVIKNPLLFYISRYLAAENKTLKAGEYAFDPQMSPQDILRAIANGEVVVRKVTIAEGLTVTEAIKLIQAAEGLEGEFTEPFPAEGSLLPETYFYTRGERRNDLLRRMQDGMHTTLADLWERRPADFPLKTKEEAVILASIVEKETALASERPRVAGVFFNRLRKAMPLQSDPTVIYALTKGKEPLGRELRRADLAVDDPYNTYRYGGLPPGPIANPGRDSLRAVLQPVTSEDLYFVADGNGGHAFARTLSEHNQNVAKWRAIVRQRQQQPSQDGQDNGQALTP